MSLMSSISSVKDKVSEYKGQLTKFVSTALDTYNAVMGLFGGGLMSTGNEQTSGNTPVGVGIGKLTQASLTSDTSKSGQHGGDGTQTNTGNGIPSLRPLKRMSIVYGGITVNFAVNPEDLTFKFPHKGSITQTKGGAWIDTWGMGIPEITIRGITGVRGSRGTDIDVGYRRWRELRALFMALYDSVRDGEEVTEYIQLYDYTDNEFWYCYPSQQGIELYRSKSQPHVFQYTIGLWGISPIPIEPSTSVDEMSGQAGTIGDPTKTKEDNGTQTTNTDNTTKDATASDVKEAQQAETGSTNTGNTNVTQDENDGRIWNGDKTGYSIPETKNGERTITYYSADNTKLGSSTYDATTGALKYRTNLMTNTTTNGSPTSEGVGEGGADVTTVVTSYSRTTSLIRSDCARYADRLGPRIGGSGGKLSPSTAYGCTRGIKLISTGRVTNVTPFSGLDWIKNWNTDLYGKKDEYKVKLLYDVKFTPYVFADTYTMFNLIRKYNTAILNASISPLVNYPPLDRVKSLINSDRYGSSIYMLMVNFIKSNTISTMDLMRLKITLLDIMLVYRQLYRMSCLNNELKTCLTVSGINRITNNISAMIYKFYFDANDETRESTEILCNELRIVQKILNDVKVYVVTYL